MADKLKFALALLLVISGVVGFYYLGEQPTILRVLSVLAGLGAGVAVAWSTTVGRRFIEFSREAVVETKKVVWPSRLETMQTTGIVFALTAISYGVMAFREARPAGAADELVAVRADHPLLVWMSRHGEAALMAELAFLAICTFAAIGTDEFWQRRANLRNNPNQKTANVR